MNPFRIPTPPARSLAPRPVEELWHAFNTERTRQLRIADGFFAIVTLIGLAIGLLTDAGPLGVALGLAFSGGYFPIRVLGSLMGYWRSWRRRA